MHENNENNVYAATTKREKKMHCVLVICKNVLLSLWTFYEVQHNVLKSEKYLPLEGNRFSVHKFNCNFQTISQDIF